MSTCIPLATTYHILTSLLRSWLFPQVDAALHHGGSGTTGASLRGASFCLRRSFWMMTYPTSWHPYSDSSFFRVSCLPYEL